MDHFQILKNFLQHRQIIGNCYSFQILQIIILMNFIFVNCCSGWYFCKPLFWTTFLQIVVLDDIFANCCSGRYFYKSLFWMIFLQIVLKNQFFLQILVVDNLFANFKKCCSEQLFCKIVDPDQFFFSENPK